MGRKLPLHPIRSGRSALRWFPEGRLLTELAARANKTPVIFGGFAQSAALAHRPHSLRVDVTKRQ